MTRTPIACLDVPEMRRAFMIMAYLKCLSCRGVIRPDEVMAMLVTVKPCEWRRTIDAQLALTPGVWHWVCLPQAVRQYIPAVVGDKDTTSNDIPPRVIEDAGTL